MQNPTKHAAEVVDEMRKMMPRDESRVGSKETRPALASGQTERSGADFHPLPSDAVVVPGGLLPEAHIKFYL